MSTAKSNRQRRSFPDAFKLEAMAAIQEGRPVTAVAAELGLPDRLVRAWLRWAEGRIAAGSGASAPTPAKEQAAPACRVGPSPADQAAEIGRLRRVLLQSSVSSASRNDKTSSTQCVICC